SVSETQEKPNGLSVGSDSETQAKAHQAPSTNLPISTKEAASIPPPEAREPEPAAAIADPIQARALEFAQLLRPRGASVQPGNPQLRRWAEQGVTDAQILQALEIAQQRRENARSAAPISAGFLDSILPDVRAAPTHGRPPTPAQKRSAWGHEMAAVIAEATAEQPREIDMGVIDVTDQQN